MAVEREKVERDRGTMKRTKIGLALCFLAGLAMVLAGIRGQKELAESGFGSENGFQAIYALSADMAEAWGSLEKELAELSGAENTAADAAAEALLQEAWKGSEENLTEILNGAGNQKKSTTWKLLYLQETLNGPKVPSTAKKSISGMSAENGKAFRQALIRSMGDESLGLPAEAEAAAGGLTGPERREMLAQLIVTSQSAGNAEYTEHVNQLKKSVRGKELQRTAFRMIAGGEINWIRQIIIGNSRTVILIGVLLMLDTLVLALLMRAERNWRMDFKWIMILGIVDFLLVFQVLPVIYMVIRAFWPEGEFSLTTVERLFSYPLNWEALKNTLIASFATMILGTLIAFPLAWLVGRTNLYGKKFFRALFVLTYMVPPYVGAMAWLRLMNPNVGTINQWLRVIFHLSDTPGPLNVYTVPGMIWVLTTFYYPYAFITISRAMEKMDPSLEEASRISGATPVKTIFTVTLPMMTPSLIAGALLVFISAASCYGIPSIIGTPGNVNTVTTRIVEYVALGQQGLNDATGLAIFLMVVALGILFLSDVVLAKKQYITVSGKSVQPAIVDLRGWRTPLTILVSLFAGIMVLLPFATILTTSFKIDIGKSMLAEGNFTTANWTSIFSRGETISCLKNSLIFAAVAATVGLIIACVMSYLLQRTRIRGRTIPNFLITLGSGTPSVVIALGLIMTMRGNFGVNIYNTAYILIIAYLIKYLMMGMRTVVSAMSQIHVSLEECSQVSGASWLRTMFRITGPLIFPSIAAGWFLIFIPSFYELSMTTLLYSSTTKTIGYQLYEYWTFTSQPMSCAMAFGILLIVIGLNFVLNRLTKGEFSI